MNKPGEIVVVGLSQISRGRTIEVPAKWVVEPGDESVSVGSHVAIHFQTQGFPKPTVKWKQAVASPSIRSRPQKEMVRRGETVRLRCEAEGDKPIRISWMAKGISLNDTKDPRFATIRHPGSAGSGSPSISELTIRDISIEDRGVFECIGVNEFGQDAFRISVLVQERPQIPKNFRIVEHASRTAVLSWSSQPASTTDQDSSNLLDYILWYKDASENWSEQTNKKSTSGDKTSILVTGLSPALTYDFRLFARNQLGMSDASETLQITTDGEAPGGPPLHISVEAKSSSQIRVSWQPPAKAFRHGQILGYNVGLRKARDESESFNWTKKGTSTQESAVISINLVGLDKYTEYEVAVSAFNEIGQGPPTQSLMITTLEDVPSAPAAEVTCSSPSAHTISISWQPPPKKHSNGIIVSYLVALEQVEEEDELFGGGPPTELESRIINQATVLHGLLPYTNYSIQVAATTNVGDGELSEPIFCRTLETVPEAPADVKVVSTGSNSFMLSWMPPRKPNGSLTKYHVYLRLMDESGREVRTVKRTVPSSTITYEVTEVKRREAYEMWITAETGVGEGAQTPVVKFGGGSSVTTSTVTPNDNVPAGIVSFGRSVTVPWKTDVLLPCITVGYPNPIVNWKKRETKTIDPSSTAKYEINGKNHTLKIKNVQKTDSMNYTCLARNPSQSQHIVYTLLVQVPPTAPLLHPTLVTSTSVRLSWKQGDNGGSAVRGFILNFRTLDGEWEEITLSRKLSTYQVDLLKCGQVYEFFCSAFNKIGSGEQSHPVKVTTKGSRPLIPVGHQFLEAGSTSLRINLNPWDQPDCPVTLFTIEYKVKSPSSSWSSVRHELSEEGRRPSSSSSDNKVIQINELTPETPYKIRIRAVNGGGSSTAEYEVSTSVLKGGLRSGSKFNFSSGVPSSSSSASSNNNGDNDEDHALPFYQDLHIILPLIIALFAIISATASVLLWIKKKKVSEEMMQSTNSLTYRHDPHTAFGYGGRGGGIDYMGDRDYTVIRAKVMPGCNDYVPESADDIYPYATFHLPEKENFAENIRQGFLGPQPPPFSQRLSNPETIRIRQIPRGGPHQQRRKSHGSLGRGSVVCEESEAGESDEYDDSCGSEDSEAVLGPINGNKTSSIRLGGGGGLYSTNGTINNRENLYNDETLLAFDSKSSPRRARSNVFEI